MSLGFLLEWVRTTGAGGDILGPMLTWSLCPVFSDYVEPGTTLRWTATVQ